MKTKLINGEQGMHFEYPNGLTLSIQHGPGHYCDNRWEREPSDPTETVEIALINRDTDEFIYLNDSVDAVIGGCPVSALPTIMSYVQGSTKANAETLPMIIRGIIRAIKNYEETQKTA